MDLPHGVYALNSNRVFLTVNCCKAMKYSVAQSKGYAYAVQGLSEHDEAVAIPYPCL